VKRVLIVSPHWLPANTPDLQRVRTSLPHYRAHGWDPVVLGVRADAVDAVQEPELEATVPADIPIHRCGALPRRWTRLVGLGNLGWRCLPSLWSAGRRLLREGGIDLVFMSTTQFTTIAAARAWKAEFGVPYVVDVQDPWRTDAYERPGAPRPPGGAKYRFARAVARLLEEPLFREAAGFVSVSAGYLGDLCARYPRWMPGRPADTIPFGVSAEDVTRARPAVPHLVRPESRPVEVVYTGAAVLGEAMDRFFDAIAELRQRTPRLADRLRLSFIGTRYSGPPDAPPLIRPLAERHGISDLLVEKTGRVGYFESLRLQGNADLLFLPGSNDPDYTPSKLPLYLLAGPPVLALARLGSTLHRTLEALDARSVIAFPAGAEHERIRAEILARLEELLAGTAADWPRIPRAAVLDRWGAAALTGRQCAVFDRAWAAHHRREEV
jgi:hypothetical protein